MAALVLFLLPFLYAINAFETSPARRSFPPGSGNAAGAPLPTAHAVTTEKPDSNVQPRNAAAAGIVASRDSWNPVRDSAAPGILYVLVAQEPDRFAQMYRSDYFSCFVRRGFETRLVRSVSALGANAVLINCRKQCAAVVAEARAAGVRNLGVFHMADENSNHPVDYYGDVDFVFRNYYDEARATLPHVVWVPNGYNHYLRVAAAAAGSGGGCADPCECMAAAAIKPASRRKYLWSYMGSNRRNRKAMFEHAQAAATVAWVNATGREAFLNNGAWHAANTKQNVVYDDYNAIVGDSVFTLCPCGNNAETHRFWEALQLGSIPIIEDCVGKESAGAKAKNYLTPLRESTDLLITLEKWESLLDTAQDTLRKARATALGSRSEQPAAAAGAMDWSGDEPLWTGMDVLQAMTWEWWSQYQGELQAHMSQLILRHWVPDAARMGKPRGTHDLLLQQRPQETRQRDGQERGLVE